MNYDCCVIGGGIVGLATAREFLFRRPGARLLLLEKERELAWHQTGHNSGVVHAGVYYAPGSLKARLCREGNHETKAFCREHAIPLEECGKLIVATNEIELERLTALHGRCSANGIAVEALNGAALRAEEPRIAGLGALLVPSTGIVDYRRVSDMLAHDIRRLGGEVRVSSYVRGIAEQGSHVDVWVGRSERIEAQYLIACAGLQSDRLARLAGVAGDFRIVPFRGEYFRLAAQRQRIARHLIYPVPDPALPFLGIHLTRMIDGGVTVGPNAVLGFAREKYGSRAFNFADVRDALGFPGTWRLLRKHWRSALAELRASIFKLQYLQECRKYCPELELADLLPCRPGIRAQAVLADGTLLHDFRFADTARMTHVLNAPSPAATAAIPIARFIATRALKETHAVSADSSIAPNDSGVE